MNLIVNIHNPIYLVYPAGLVYLVHPVSFVQPNTRDRPNRPDREAEEGFDETNTCDESDERGGIVAGNGVAGVVG